MEEFYAKRRKNDFRYKTELNQNNERVSEIINSIVRIIRKNKELEDDILKDKEDDYRNYMEATGFWVESVFYSYMNRVMDEIESKID